MSFIFGPSKKAIQDCTALVDAVSKLDEAQIRRLKAAGVSVDCWESEQGVKACENVPKTGAVGTPWFRPLHIFSQQDNPEAIKLLLKYGADPNSRDTHGRTPIFHAPSIKTREALFASKRLDVEPVDQINLTPLLYAVEGNDTTVVNYFLDRGANVNGVEGHLPPLHVAAAFGYPGMASLLIKRGADVHNGASRWHGTAVHMAVCTPTEAERILLCRTVASFNKYTGSGWSKSGDFSGRTEYVKGQSGHAAVIRLLVAKGADLSALDNRNLMEAGFENKRNHVQRATAAFRATELGRLELLQLLGPWRSKS
jgi:Ankyrin repeats (3 copies)/Ankyrin repeat